MECKDNSLNLHKNGDKSADAMNMVVANQCVQNTYTIFRFSRKCNNPSIFS